MHTNKKPHKKQCNTQNLKLNNIFVTWFGDHDLKGQYHGDRSKLCFSRGFYSVPFLFYKIILEHQEKEINQILERGASYDLLL